MNRVLLTFALMLSLHFDGVAAEDGERVLLTRYQTILVYLASDERHSVDREALLHELELFLLINYYYFKDDVSTANLKKSIVKIYEKLAKQNDGHSAIWKESLERLNRPASDLESVRLLVFSGFDAATAKLVVKDAREKGLNGFREWLGDEE
jgi:hypothetical protein